MQNRCKPQVPSNVCSCRTTHFFASAEKAKRELGWTPKHDFLSDVDELVKDYLASGRQDAEIDFSIDDKILAAMKVYA